MKTLDELRNFIDRALKSRKYFPNVATNYKAPLKWIETELTDEEKDSPDVFKKNIDQIFNLLYSKHSDKLSAASIEVYKKRVKNLIGDYEAYGKDPAAMAKWNRPIITRVRTKNKLKAEIESSDIGKVVGSDNNAPIISSEEISSLTKHEEFLSHGKAYIFTPEKLETSDLNILQAYLSYLKIRMNSNKNNSKNEESSSESNDSSQE